MPVSPYFRVAIVAVWLGLLFVLWKGPGGSTTAAPSGLLPETADSAREGWMGLYMNGKKVGYSHFELTPTENGQLLSDRSVLRLRMMERNQTVHAQTTAEIDQDYALRSFHVRLNSGIGQFRLEGAVENGTLAVEVLLGAETDRREFPIDQPIYLPSALRARLVANGLRADNRVEAAVFDPAAMAAEPISIHTVGLETLDSHEGEIPAWRIVESFRGIDTTVWLDEKGAVLREEGPMGLLALREDRERATGSGWAKDSLVDLMDAVAIPVRPGIESPRDLRRLALRLEGLGKLSPPSDARQAVSGQSMVITREDAAARATFELPYAGTEWTSGVEATAFVQSTHPRIAETAARVLDGERDARNAVVRLRNWVYATLEKRPVASIPNALQVLEMGAGDCNEHAVLFAGLARAAGVPTRINAGVVYSEGVFLYHAWNEVWLGQGWVSVDPAFNQMPADATHIKLVEGEPDKHIELVPVIGKLSIEVLEADLSESAVMDSDMIVGSAAAGESIVVEG